MRARRNSYKHHEDDDADEEEEDANTRGAHRRLAQRHHVLVAGRFRGMRALTPEEAAPGCLGQLALCFTTRGVLPSESRITCQLPDHGWRPTEAHAPETSTADAGTPLNALLRLPQSCAAPALRARWFTASRTLEFTLASGDGGVDADTPVVILVSGVRTPESATPQAECVVTAFEKLVLRNTTPPSTRGGQIIDGPCAFAVPKILPGQLSGPRRWLPFSCSPGVVSDVSLSFRVNGAVPLGGRILIELPADGWDMREHPSVLLRNAQHRNSVVPALWTRTQHALEITVAAGIPMKSSVTLTVANVRNPANETLVSASRGGGGAAVARITTLSASGGVVDGPSKLDVAPISELRDSDFEVARTSFDAEDTEHAGHILVEKIPEVLKHTGVRLSDELYQSLVVANLPTRTPPTNASPPDTDNENAPHDKASSSTPQSPSTAELLGPDRITRDEFLNVFASVYAPAYKFGQELRLACGRGQVDSVNGWLSRGCDPNAKDGSGWAALHYAADFGQLGVVQALLDSRAAASSNLEVNARDGCGWTPLMCAAANGHTQVVAVLVDAGADVLLASVEGRTALHWAAARDMTGTVQVLLDSCRDANVVGMVDRSGWSPLHCALLHGSESCAKLLVSRGASTTLVDKLQHPPTHYGAMEVLQQ